MTVASFLTEWYSGHAFTLTAIAPDSAPTGENFTDPTIAAQWAAMQNAAGRNVYFHVNPGQDQTGSGKLSKGELAALHALHVDIDPPASVTPDAADQWRAETVADLIARANPTIIVCSGRGLAAYWKFSQAIDVASMDYVEQANRALRAMFNGDKAAVDASRIMKLPGTTAFPNADKRAAGWPDAPAEVVGGCNQPFDARQICDWVIASAPAETAQVSVASGDIAEDLPEGPSPRWSGPTDDDTLIELMRSHLDPLRPGLQAGQFFDGETPSDEFRSRAAAMYPDPGKPAPWDFGASEADQTLVNHLCYYTGGDAARIKRLWSRSVMGSRPKVADGKRDDYLQRTIWKVKREFDANPEPSMLGKDRPSLDGLQARFLEQPTELAILDEVGKLTRGDREAFVEAVYQGAPDHTKAELTKLVAEAAVKVKKLATAERGLVFDAKGNPVQNLENCRRIMLNDVAWRGVFQYSEFDTDVWVMGAIPGDTRNLPAPRKYTDADALFTMSWFQSNDFTVIGDKTVRNAIVAAAHANTFHQVRDYLTGLSWDGQPRLGALFTHYFPCEVKDDSFLAYLQTAAQRFGIAAVARIMKPGCKVDTMPILSGAQGLKKSSGFHALFGEAWSGSDMPDLTSKDAKEWMRGKWLAEFAELSSMSGKDIDHVKNFMSTATDRFRKSYGHVVEEIPRQTVFGGSVNGDEYLMDETGNRRFWPMRVIAQVDIDGIRRDRNQLWAEAVAMFAAGHQWWFDQGECQALEVAQSNARIMDDDETFVRDWLATQKDEVTSAQVLRAVFPDKDGSRGNTMRISRYMKACGWSPARNTNGKRYWGRTDAAEPYAKPGGNNVVPLHNIPGMG